MQGQHPSFIWWNRFCLICAAIFFIGSAFKAPPDETLFRLLALPGGFFFLWLCRRYWHLIFASSFFLSLVLLEVEKIIASGFVLAFTITFIFIQLILSWHYAKNWKKKDGKWVNSWGKSWIISLLFHESSFLPKKYLLFFSAFLVIIIRGCLVAMSRSEWLFLFAYIVGIFFLSLLLDTEWKKSMEKKEKTAKEEEPKKEERPKKEEEPDFVNRWYVEDILIRISIFNEYFHSLTIRDFIIGRIAMLILLSVSTLIIATPIDWAGDETAKIIMAFLILFATIALYWVSKIGYFFTISSLSNMILYKELSFSQMHHGITEFKANSVEEQKFLLENYAVDCPSLALLLAFHENRARKRIGDDYRCLAENPRFRKQLKVNLCMFILAHFFVCQKIADEKYRIIRAIRDEVAKKKR